MDRHTLQGAEIDSTQSLIKCVGQKNLFRSRAWCIGIAHGAAARLPKRDNQEEQKMYSAINFSGIHACKAHMSFAAGLPTMRFKAVTMPDDPQIRNYDQIRRTVKGNLTFINKMQSLHNFETFSDKSPEFCHR
jgi:hypothetical protein